MQISYIMRSDDIIFKWEEVVKNSLKEGSSALIYILTQILHLLQMVNQYLGDR